MLPISLTIPSTLVTRLAAVHASKAKSRPSSNHPSSSNPPARGSLLTIFPIHSRKPTSRGTRSRSSSIYWESSTNCKMSSPSSLRRMASSRRSTRTSTVSSSNHKASLSKSNTLSSSKKPTSSSWRKLTSSAATCRTPSTSG